MAQHLPMCAFNHAIAFVKLCFPGNLIFVYRATTKAYQVLLKALGTSKNTMVLQVFEQCRANFLTSCHDRSATWLENAACFS